MVLTPGCQIEREYKRKKERSIDDGSALCSEKSRFNIGRKKRIMVWCTQKLIDPIRNREFAEYMENGVDSIVGR